MVWQATNHYRALYSSTPLELESSQLVEFFPAKSDIKNKDVLHFKDIPEKQSSDDTIRPSNTIHVIFNDTVEVRKLQVSAPVGQNLPDQIGIKVRNGREEYFEVGGEPYTDVIFLTDGVFDLSDLPLLDELYITIVFSSDESFDLTPDIYFDKFCHFQSSFSFKRKAQHECHKTNVT